MAKHRLTTTFALLALGLLGAFAPAASASSTLLSGYGGPGQGNQAILGSTLIGGGGGASGGGTGDRIPAHPDRREWERNHRAPWDGQAQHGHRPGARPTDPPGTDREVRERARARAERERRRISRAGAGGIGADSARDGVADTRLRRAARRSRGDRKRLKGRDPGPE